MRITIRTTISALAIGTVLAGTATRTAAQQRDDRLIRVDTLESGRVVISNPDAPQTGPQGAPTLVEVLRIGSVDDTCDALGYVTSVTVDGDGRIYVADQQANEIRVFSPGRRVRENLRAVRRRTWGIRLAGGNRLAAPRPSVGVRRDAASIHRLRLPGNRVGHAPLAVGSYRHPAPAALGG